MSEIKRDPFRSFDGEGETITFDASHTIADIIRWLVTENGADEVEHVLARVKLETGS